MNEEDRVWKRVERVVGKVPPYVRRESLLQDIMSDYLSAKYGPDQHEEDWLSLLAKTKELLEMVKHARAEGREEVLEGLKAGPSGGDWAMREAVSREDDREEGKLEPAWFVGPVTTAMVQAMSELFAGWAHQYPKVIEFRDKVLPGRFLTEDEVHTLITSYATRVLHLGTFAHWEIPIVGHHAEILDAPSTEQFNPIDDWVTLRIDPPGITKTVRYAYPREGDSHTRCETQNGSVIPIITELPIELHGGPSWLWPGSAVHHLYKLSEELANAFDWPVSTEDSLRQLGNDAAVWFILTGKTPEVRPIEAKWETKQGKYAPPQWRIRLTIPPWLPEREVLRAYRLLRRQIPGGKKLPKTDTTLEVFRFVSEQERQNGYNRPKWDILKERWNEEHPGHPFKTYNQFQKYFTRGKEAVRDLNFSWPLPPETEREDE